MLLDKRATRTITAKSTPLSTRFVSNRRLLSPGNGAEGSNREADMRRSFKLAVSVGLLSTILAFAGVATAKPVVQEHFDESTSTVIEDFCEIDGFTVREGTEISGHTVINARGTDRLLYFHETVHGTVTWTNLANGKSMYQVFTINDKDLEVTANGDGTFTALVLNTGGFKLYGPEGQKLKDAGQIRFEILLDEEGEFLEFVRQVKESTGTNDLEGRDFCTDALDFIG